MPYIRKNKLVEAQEDVEKTYEDIQPEPEPENQDIELPPIKKKMTPEELKAFRIANLRKATEIAKGVYDKRREEKKAKQEEERRMKAEVARLEKEALEKKKALLEKKVNLLDKSMETTEKKVTKVEKVLPKVATKKTTKKIVYVESEEEETESEEEVEIVRKKKVRKPVAPTTVIANPIEELSNRQIREEMKRLQLEMLSKSLWSN